MQKLEIVEFSSLPKEMDNKEFINAMLGSQFLISHDFREGKTLLVTDNAEAIRKLRNSIVGLSLKNVDIEGFGFGNPIFIAGYSPHREEKRGLPLEHIFSDIYKFFRHTNMRFTVSFVPSTAEQIKMVKHRIEGLASSRSIRMTKSLTGRQSDSSESVQMDLYYGSDERKVLLELLELLNKAILNNGISYKIGLVIDGEYEKCNFLDYLMSKVFVFDRSKIKALDIDHLFQFLREADAIPLSYEHASEFIEFSNKIKRESIVSTFLSDGSGEVELGEYLEGSTTGRGEMVKLDMRTFNLGMMISGVPGVGKSAMVMKLIEQLERMDKSKVVVISPTREWNGLGERLGMKVVSIYDGKTPMNFFKCSSGIGIERFYENLAMLLASASNAGPYRNSLEKSLLAAFHRIYRKTSAPDPLEAYEEIENTVIEQHGKRNNVDITLTKHGENVIAALESLRLMLLKPQFAYKDSVDFKDLIESGVIFDLSKVSNNMKPFFYALILNQIYSFTDMFDENGNDQLRMMICLEEAQLVFENIDESAATLDLKQRIQDFRKKGIGLAIVTHNVTDINLGIRRLCQTKVYFRQSSDVAKYACNDLIFTEDEKEVATDKLKGLPQGVCALSRITIDDGIRVPQASIFVRLSPYSLTATKKDILPGDSSNYLTGTALIKILGEDGIPKSGASIELSYAGEIIHRGFTDQAGIARIDGTIIDRPCKLKVLGTRKKETRAYWVVGGRENVIKV